MIEVSDLTKYYGPTRSIEGINFALDRGEILGFLGPNGAGKTTTMRLIAGLARPTRGSARVDGFDVQRDHEKVRRILGYLPEQAPLYGDMTLSGYLRFMAGVRGLQHREARMEMERTTALLNLIDERPRLLRNLSKGTRQRAAFAQALIGKPSVLILDEPTVGLDPSQINDVRELIRSLRGECTVILSTHILPEVELTCSRVVIIANGEVTAQGTPEELLGSEPAGCRLVVSGDRRRLEAILKDYGIYTIEPEGVMFNVLLEAALDSGRRATLARRLVESDLELMELKLNRPRLEDVYLRSTGRARKQ